MRWSNVAAEYRKDFLIRQVTHKRLLAHSFKEITLSFAKLATKNFLKALAALGFLFLRDFDLIIQLKPTIEGSSEDILCTLAGELRLDAH